MFERGSAGAGHALLQALPNIDHVWQTECLPDGGKEKKKNPLAPDTVRLLEMWLASCPLTARVVY